MSDSGLSVADAIFSARDAAFVDQSAETDAHPAMVKVRTKVEAELKSANWRVVRRVVIGKLAELMNDPIVQPMVEAWKKYDEVLEYCDSDKYPPDATSLVPLKEHTVKATLKPYLAMFLHGKEITRLQLLVTLALKLQGIHLEIRGGKIMKIHTGSCQGSGTIAIEGQTFYEKKPAAVQLPGTIDLGAGVPLRGK